MKKSTKTIVVILLFVEAFMAGAFTATIAHVAAPIVTLDVTNQSDKSIRALEFAVDNGLTTIIKGIDPTNTRKVNFYTRGEAAFKVRAQFSDGSVLVGDGAYVEPGYEIKIEIMDKSIDVKHVAFHRYKP